MLYLHNLNGEIFALRNVNLKDHEAVEEPNCRRRCMRTTKQRAAVVRQKNFKKFTNGFKNGRQLTRHLRAVWRLHLHRLAAALQTVNKSFHLFIILLEE